MSTCKNRHGGDMEYFRRISGRGADEILDFSVNVNPEGMPDFLRAAVLRNMDAVSAYPEPFAESAVKAAAAFHGIQEGMVVFGNGSNQIIHAIPRALGISNAVIFEPGFSEYEKACRLAGIECHFIVGAEKNNFLPALKILPALKPGTAVFVANPGNPSGSALKGCEIVSAARKHADALFVVDEAFVEYALPETAVPLKKLPGNIIVLRSLTKFYGMAGLRAGYAVGSERNIAAIRKFIPEWSLNTFASAVVCEIFVQGREFRRKTFQLNEERRAKFADFLSALPHVKVFPSKSNYLLIRVRRNAGGLAEKLLRGYGIAVRDCSNFRGLESGGFFRVAVRGDEDNARLANALGEVLGKKTGAFHVPARHKPSLMFQGTSSNAGKSILTAAFCRILLDDGYRVAPFKAQNMALNSYVTLGGGEIGRAQAVQAQACRIEPDPRVNPILLKPNTDTGCQVVVMGKALRNMNVAEYFRYKKDVFRTVTAAYDSLEKEFDAVVLEGAGSPGEINLKDGDIVNMRMARHAGSPVLLVGDIDRGGVYASFIGTVDTFEPWERKLLAGFIVNKFRGDASLLKPAHDYVHNCTGKSVLGVIPYIHDIGIPEEDMARIPFEDISAKEKPCLDAALIVLRHTSNFTDFAPLAIEPDVNVRLVRKASDFGRPDIIIIPGSKNVIGDLKKLSEEGLAEKIVARHREGAWLVGVCGGLQICGRMIEDPHGIESSRKSAPGLGLINLHTRLEPDKTLFRAENVSTPFNIQISGYEIHHGRTRAAEGVREIMRRSDGTAVGFAAEKVWTTYLHGVFDDDEFRRRFIDMVREDRGMPGLGSVKAVYSTENAIRKLAETVRENVDLRQIYRKMGFK